jgi:hypothetical protein
VSKKKQGHLGDEEAQNRLRQREKLKTRQLVDDSVALMSTGAGRRFVYDLIHERCGWGSETFTGNSQTFHLEGMRSVAVRLAKDLQEWCPEAWVRMVAEAIESKKSDDIHHNAAVEAATQETDA